MLAHPPLAVCFICGKLDEESKMRLRGPEQKRNFYHMECWRKQVKLEIEDPDDAAESKFVEALVEHIKTAPKPWLDEE